MKLRHVRMPMRRMMVVVAALAILFHILEMCEFENPEIVRRPNPNAVEWIHSPSQIALERQLLKRYQERVEAESASSRSETESGTARL
jgi:hypothetical protein